MIKPINQLISNYCITFCIIFFSGEAKLSYLVPRDPSIKCWEDRVKLAGPLTTNMVKHDIDALQESVNERLKVYLRIKPSDDDIHSYTVLNNTLEVEAPKDKKLAKDVDKLVHK